MKKDRQMKKNLIAFFLIINIFYSCTKKEEPSAPDTNQQIIETSTITATATITQTSTIFATFTYTHTIVVLPVSSMLDDFEDADYNNLLDGDWYIYTDAETGGSSSITSWGIIQGGHNSSYALGVTANVITSLDEDLNRYTIIGGVKSNKSGYIRLRTALYPQGCSFGNNFMFFLSVAGTGMPPADTFFGVIILNSQKQYLTASVVQTGTIFNTNWTGTNFNININNFNLPADATYTKEDVYNHITDIDLIIRISGNQDTNYLINFFIDELNFSAP